MLFLRVCLLFSTFSLFSFSYIYIYFYSNKIPCFLLADTKDNVERRSKRKLSIEKRQMCYMASIDDVISKKADNLFLKDERKIRHRIRRMCHATRFWLAVKLYRMQRIDFISRRCIDVKYSKHEICRIIGVSRESVANYVAKIAKTDSVSDLMKKNNYLSPIEVNPKRHESFFKRYASNYQALKVAGYFAVRSSKK